MLPVASCLQRSSFDQPSVPFPQIVLRTINSSQSAYLSVTFAAAFFDAYDVLDCNVVQAGLLMKVGAGCADLQVLGRWWAEVLQAC